MNAVDKAAEEILREFGAADAIDHLTHLIARAISDGQHWHVTLLDAVLASIDLGPAH